MIIGAGSHSSGSGTVADVLREPARRGRGLELALVDADGDALGRVQAATLRLRDSVPADFRLGLAPAAGPQHPVEGASRRWVSVILP